MSKYIRKESPRDRDKYKKFPTRQKMTLRYQLPKDAVIDYKNISLLQKYLNERGKIVPRRISDISSKDQRRLAAAIKQARFLALLPTGGVRQG